MPDPAFAEAAEIGFEPTQVRRAEGLLEQWAATGAIPAAALCVGRHGRVITPRLFGRQRPDGDEPIRPEALFLVASLTKPVTATAVVMLAEEGKLGLDDRV